MGRLASTTSGEDLVRANVRKPSFSTTHGEYFERVCSCDPRRRHLFDWIFAFEARSGHHAPWRALGSPTMMLMVVSRDFMYPSRSGEGASGHMYHDRIVTQAAGLETSEEKMLAAATSAPSSGGTGT